MAVCWGLCRSPTGFSASEEEGIQTSCPVTMSSGSAALEDTTAKNDPMKPSKNSITPPVTMKFQ